MLKKFMNFSLVAVVVLLFSISVPSQHTVKYMPYMFEAEPLMPQLKEVKLKTLDGVDFKWDDTDGKIIFINNWGTWYTSADTELTSLQKLYDINKNRIAFLLIAYDNQEAIPPFISKFNFSFPVYLPSDKENEDKIVDILHLEIIPTTCIIPISRKCSFHYLGRLPDWYSKDVFEMLKDPQC